MLTTPWIQYILLSLGICSAYAFADCGGILLTGSFDVVEKSYMLVIQSSLKEWDLVMAFDAFPYFL